MVLTIKTLIIKFGNKYIHVVSYYSPPDHPLSQDLFKQIEEKTKNYIICGDLNSRSCAIGCVGTNQKGDTLLEILAEHECHVYNAFSPPTYTKTQQKNNYEE